MTETAEEAVLRQLAERVSLFDTDELETLQLLKQKVINGDEPRYQNKVLTALSFGTNYSGKVVSIIEVSWRWVSSA